MSRTKASKVFAIAARPLKRGLCDASECAEVIGHVIARHGKGAMTIARASFENLPGHAFAMETDASNAKSAINYSAKETA